MMDLTHFPLQFVTDGPSPLPSVEAALAAGCRWVQLRMKQATTQERRRAAIDILRACRDAGATFIVDDDVQLCADLRADGVHLGANDLPVALARKSLGDSYIIGATCHDAPTLLRAEADGASYAGCGPWRFTTTKSNLAEPLGPDGLRELVWLARSQGSTMPIVAIGGIVATDVPLIRECGADGIAVSGAIAHAADPLTAARELAEEAFKLF